MQRFSLPSSLILAALALPTLFVTRGTASTDDTIQLPAIESKHNEVAWMASRNGGHGRYGLITVTKYSNGATLISNAKQQDPETAKDASVKSVFEVSSR